MDKHLIVPALAWAINMISFGLNSAIVSMGIGGFWNVGCIVINLTCIIGLPISVIPYIKAKKKLCQK